MSVRSSLFFSEEPDLHVFRSLYDDQVHFESHDLKISDYDGVSITVEQMDALVAEYLAARNWMLKWRDVER